MHGCRIQESCRPHGASTGWRRRNSVVAAINGSRAATPSPNTYTVQAARHAHGSGAVAEEYHPPNTASSTGASPVVCRDAAAPRAFRGRCAMGGCRSVGPSPGRGRRRTSRRPLGGGARCRDEGHAQAGRAWRGRRSAAGGIVRHAAVLRVHASSRSTRTSAPAATILSSWRSSG